MTWRIVVVNQHSKLSYQNNALIYKSANGIEKIHLSEIHTLMLETTDIVITSALVAKLISYKIKLIFCDEKRLPSAELHAYYGSHDSSRAIAQQIAWPEDIQAIVWTAVIKQKIINQARHLKSRGLDAEHGRLLSYIDELNLYDESNREGHAAKVYFNGLFGKNFTREQTNDINASLDYGYALLLSIFSREIVKNGCLTQLGLKHSNVFNHYNLASDLMEPFRPLIDEIVYRNRTEEFPKIKRQLFEIYNRTYHFEGQDKYLINIAEIYVKKVIDCLHKASNEVPIFEYTWENMEKV
ncbi:type II CRISPR-associated endonuclease Cas1 [Lactococcus ileimucosae]|uniref:type II CRISPR-associated endonuclease Cas1 n=1 Tax=Lactococcus ileimucosae TaxID=2941329 RepID=UPI0035152EE9